MSRRSSSRKATRRERRGDWCTPWRARAVAEQTEPARRRPGSRAPQATPASESISRVAPPLIQSACRARTGARDPAGELILERRLSRPGHSDTRITDRSLAIGLASASAGRCGKQLLLQRRIDEGVV